MVLEKIHTSPTEGLFSKTPTRWKFQLNFIHFFKCYTLYNPPCPRKFQFLLLGEYGYTCTCILELCNFVSYMLILWFDYKEERWPQLDQDHVIQYRVFHMRRLGRCRSLINPWATTMVSWWESKLGPHHLHPQVFCSRQETKMAACHIHCSTSTISREKTEQSTPCATPVNKAPDCLHFKFCMYPMTEVRW